MEHDFQGTATHDLACMRLIAEGAVTLYESEMNNVYQSLLDAGKMDAALAVDTLGTALHQINQMLQELQRQLVKSNNCFR